MRIKRCSDAGRNGCPCALAEANKCMVCGKLSGSTCNDCSWQGSCIYTLLKQNHSLTASAREEQRLRVVDRIGYGQHLTVLVLECDKGFCQKAATPGAFIFARRTDESSTYDMPVSILKSDPSNHKIHIGINPCGCKSLSLLLNSDALTVRGIFYSGLIFGEDLSADRRSVIYCKGIAIAPLHNFLHSIRYSKYLKNLTLYVDLEKISFDFLKDYFGDLPVTAINTISLSEETIKSTVGDEPVNLFVLTSPHYASLIKQLWNQEGIYPNFANMCCGEGICGACALDDSNGQTVHRCKILQLNK